MTMLRNEGCEASGGDNVRLPDKAVIISGEALADEMQAMEFRTRSVERNMRTMELRNHTTSTADPLHHKPADHKHTKPVHPLHHKSAAPLHHKPADPLHHKLPDPLHHKLPDPLHHKLPDPLHHKLPD